MSETLVMRTKPATPPSPAPALRLRRGRAAASGRLLRTVGATALLLAAGGNATAQAADAAVAAKAEACAACHGSVGQSTQPLFPILAGQTARYTYLQLRDFKARTRTNDAGSMTSVANTLSTQDIENIAHYVTGL